MATMNDASMSIKASELIGNTTCTVRLIGVKRLRFRIWLGSKFIALAAWVMGCGIRIEEAGIISRNELRDMCREAVGDNLFYQTTDDERRQILFPGTPKCRVVLDDCDIPSGGV